MASSTQLLLVLMTLAALVSALVAIPYKRTVLDEKDVFCLLTCAECFDDGKQVREHLRTHLLFSIDHLEDCRALV